MPGDSYSFDTSFDRGALQGFERLASHRTSGYVACPSVSMKDASTQEVNQRFQVSGSRPVRTVVMLSVAACLVSDKTALETAMGNLPLQTFKG